jgi:hypothetical protein
VSYIQWFFARYLGDPVILGLALSVVLLAGRALSSSVGWRQRLAAAVVAIVGGVTWWRM